MTQLNYSDVFKPAAYPEKTYVDRTHQNARFSYEDRLKKALANDGFLVSITGPSKTGKTVLCERAIGGENIVAINGNDLEQYDNFWEAVAIEAGIPITGATSNAKTSQEGVGTSTTGLMQSYAWNKKMIIEHFIQYKKV